MPCRAIFFINRPAGICTGPLGPKKRQRTWAWTGLGDALRIEFKGEIGVRRGYQIRGAMRGGHAHHGERIVQSPRAVIQAMQHVAVQVDQDSILAQH